MRRYRQSRAEPDSPDGFATCVSLLLAAGADPNLPSRQGQYTALMGACLSGEAECCRLLLQAGARTDCVASDDLTAVVCPLLLHHSTLLFFNANS